MCVPKVCNLTTRKRAPTSGRAPFHYTSEIIGPGWLPNLALYMCGLKTHARSAVEIAARLSGFGACPWFYYLPSLPLPWHLQGGPSQRNSIFQTPPHRCHVSGRLCFSRSPPDRSVLVGLLPPAAGSAGFVKCSRLRHLGVLTCKVATLEARWRNLWLTPSAVCAIRPTNCFGFRVPGRPILVGMPVWL